MPPFRTLDDVVAGLAEIEQRLREKQDRRCIFATLYGVVSSEMRDRVAANAFLDTAWVHRYAVAFANLYRDALDAYDSGRMLSVPRAWRLGFDVATGGTGLVLQDMLLGVNAHVNNDLPIALERVSIGPDRAQRRRDHDAVNAVLASVTERATQRLSALYAPGFTTLDECAGEIDEMLSLFSLQIARDSAWEAAQSLTDARGPVQRGVAAGVIAARAAGIAQLLLAPSRNAGFLAACRRLEAGSSWMALVGEIRKAVGHTSISIDT
jgi:hypothetical protein